MNENITSLPKFGRSAEVSASSFDEKDNSIEVVWTTGASVRRVDWRSGRYYNEILEVTADAVRLERLNAGAPLLDTHDDWSLRSVIGSVVPGSAKLEGSNGIARVRLSNAAGDADVVSKIRDGIIRNISVGYAIHKVVKTEADRDGADDEWRVVDWEPMEISAVPIPADAGSQFRKADKAEQFPCVVVSTRSIKEAIVPESVIAAGDTPAISQTSTNNQEGRLVAETNTESRAADPVVTEPVIVDRAADHANAERAAKKAADDAVAAERKRVSEIRTLAKEGNEVELGDAAIAAGHSVDTFRSALLEALMKREAPAADPVVKVGEEHHEKRAALLEAALKDRAGVNDVELNDGAREYRGMTLLDMAREALELRGEKTRGLAREEIARRALMQRSGGYGSTSDFPIILGNVMRTTLRAAYDVAGQTFRPLVRQTTVPDFRSVSSAQLGGGMSFKKVNEHGEYKRSSLTESKEQYRVATYGTIIGVTRQVIINDDMNAFGRIPSLFGRDAANLESNLVWAQIAGNPTMGDGVALFHATHKNLPTAAAFSVAALGVAKALMAKQVDTDGTTVLNVRPSYLIVPVDLETKAEQELKLVSSLALSDSTKVATNSMRSLQIISEPRLDNGFTNPDTGAAISGSSTAWYLASAPSNIDVVELAYLADSGGAVHTETRYGFDVDGVEFKARLDVGAKTMDHRGLLKNAGA